LIPRAWISEPYHNDGCKKQWFALVPMFAALRKSAIRPLPPTPKRPQCPELIEADMRIVLR
jgi:hypothetical protein